MSEDGPAIVERVVSLLREEGRALPSAEVARRVLGLVGPGTVLAASILEAALAGEPRLREESGSWRLVEEALSPAPPDVEAAVWVHLTGPRPPMDRPLTLAFRVRDGTAGEERCDPGGPVRPERLAALGLRPTDLEGARAPAAARDALALALGTRGVVVWDRAQARVLGPTIRPALVLAPRLAAAGAVRHGASVVDAAASLGASWDGTVDATSLAALVLRLHDAARDEGLLEATEETRPDAAVPAWVIDLPDGPGVYRLVSSDGELLYVGKARSLRSRVRTYFGSSDRRRRHEELMARVAGARVEETASEAEALLLEAEAIREERPPYNVQRDTGRRAGRLGDAVLFLPGNEDDVLAVLVVDGRVAERVTIGSHRRGVGRLDAAIRRHAFGGETPPEDEGAGEILKTWLRRAGDETSVLDLAAVTSATAASRLVRAYLADPDVLRGSVVHRD